MTRIAPKPRDQKDSMRENQRLIKRLDAAVSLLVRERDKDKPCIDMCGDTWSRWQAGHFRPRWMMSTRYDLKNINRQQMNCNYYRSHKNDLIRHERGIDERWGKGTADMLYELSKKTRGFTNDELRALIAAAKKGIEEYEKTYYSLTNLLTSI